MTRKEILILTTPLLLFLGCFNNDTQNDNYFLGSSSTNFKKEGDTSSSYYKYSKGWEHNLKLGNIENGVEGFQIRLWYNPEIVNNKKLILVNHSTGDWSAKAYHLTVSIDDGISLVAIDSVVALTPKSGWKSFQNKLAELQVKQLPNHSASQGDKLIDDGITYFVEVANHDLYRFTWFSNPQENIKNNKSAKLWQDVVDVFNQEFDVSKQAMRTTSALKNKG